MKTGNPSKKKPGIELDRAAMRRRHARYLQSQAGAGPVDKQPQHNVPLELTEKEKVDEIPPDKLTPIETDVAPTKDFAGATHDELLAVCESKGVPPAAIAKLREGLERPTSEEKPSTAFASATLDELVATLDNGEAVAPDGLVERLATLVKAEQPHGPKDRDSFEKKVNDLLEGYSWRFKLDDGKLARLRVMSSGTLRFSVPGGDNRSFGDNFEKIVPVILKNKRLQPLMEGPGQN